MHPAPDTPRKLSGGFTLLELLAAITVLAAILGLLLPIIIGIKQSGFNASAKRDEKQIIDAIQAYQVDYGAYPIDHSKIRGDAVFDSQNNVVLDVLRNVHGLTAGNALNPRGTVYLKTRYTANEEKPAGGIQSSSGVWFDPWGTPYSIAIDGDDDNNLNGFPQLPNFYSDVGALHAGVIVWSFGKNGILGGGGARQPGFGNEGGKEGELTGSGDVVSWQ